MRTLKTLLTNLLARVSGRRPGVVTALLLAGILFGAVHARAATETEAVYLYSGSGYVDVTPYLQVDLYGNVWVVGYNNEPSFEIVVDVTNGHVLDPYGDQIGICVPEP